MRLAHHFISNLSLLPVLYFMYVCFHSSESLQVFGKENYISPRNSQQYFYKISPMMMIQVPNKVSLTVYNFLINIALLLHNIIHLHYAAKSCVSGKDGPRLEVKVW